MSGSGALELVTVYVRLMDEGTEALRPTQAVVLGNDTYELMQSDTYDPQDECWEFVPSSRVHVVPCQTTNGDHYLLAVSKAD